MLSKVLYGKKGSDFDSVIKPLVRQALCTGSKKEGCDCYSCSLALSSHPDYKEYDQEKYSVEEIDEISAYAEGIPVISSNRVVVLKNFSGVTEISQNKLLKELEDNKHFILIATDNSEDCNILPTIKSRTEAVAVSSEHSLDEFRKEFGEQGDILFVISEKNLGLAKEMIEQIPIYQNVEKALLDKDKRLLMESLNLVKNKDKDCYFTKYKAYVPVLFNFMANVAMRFELDRTVALLNTLNTEKSKCLRNWYDTNNFIVSIVNIAESL